MRHRGFFAVPFIFCLLKLSLLGGDEGNRTLDPLLAGQVLSQLSYTPMVPGSQRLIDR